MPAVYPLTVPGQDITFNSNSNASGTQFEVEFKRAIFSNLVSPTPGATPTPTPKPGATPTPPPSWLANCFVTSEGTTGSAFGGSGNTNYQPVDSLGQGGAADNTYVFTPPLDTTIAFNQTYEAENDVAPTQSAVIQSCEFQNTP